MDFSIHPYDTDYGGVISNTTYVRWLDELRTGWFDAIISRARQQSEGLTLVVGRVEVDYLHPVAFYDGDLPVVGEIEDIERGHARVVFQARFRFGEKVVASGIQKTLLVNIAARRPARFPIDVLEKLAP
jgi:acyl-CoA thioesterase FadM